MTTTPLRWRRTTAVTAVGCALLLSSCSGGGSGSTDASLSKQNSSPTATAAPTADAAATAAQTRAVALTRRVRSYAFTAVQTLKGRGADVTLMVIDDVPHHRVPGFIDALEAAGPWVRGVWDR